MYTLPNAVRLKDHLLERWEAAERDPALVEDGALNIVIVGGGPTGVETAGAVAELYRADLAKDYPTLPQEQARVTLVEAGPELFSMFKPKLREYTTKALGDRTVEVRTGALPDHPEVYALGDIAAITDAKTEQVLPQLGSVALQSGEHAGESIARRIAGKEPKPFKYKDKGTMATIGRRAAVVQMLAGRTMTGTKAQLAWGTVHLALLPTNEDRAKAVVDWAGAGFTHQRVGRITVESE
jgi:NADH dehydrogenase